MIRQVFAAAIAAVLLSIPAAPVSAATAQPAGEAAKPASAARAERKLTPQQQKMKDCGAKWQAYKKEKNVKGRAEYRKFTSTCLKG